MIKEGGLQAGEVAELAASALQVQGPEFGTAEPTQKPQGSGVGLQPSNGWGRALASQPGQIDEL